MSYRQFLLICGLIAAIMPDSAVAQSHTCSGMTPGQLTSLNGFVPFPANNPWNTDISHAPVDPNSATYINYIGATKPVHPDFGSGLYQGSSPGIPYQIVSRTQAKVNVQLTGYPGESDPGPEPIPANALIEGYPNPGNGDRHVLVLEKDNCWLYELYGASVSNGRWSAAQSTVWDMMGNENRPYTWTSADAAGLSIFAGLARYDEVAAGAINHALRFTVPVSQKAFTAPATHWASSVTDPHAPPMGMRLRLKSSFDISGFSAQNKVILTALKKYGLILADNGSAMYISGAPDNRWNNDDLSKLKSLHASDFEVVYMSQIYTPAHVPSGQPPAIGNFRSNAAAISAGQMVTLSWTTTNASYNLISPQVGPVRGNSIMVVPSGTTTYTLYSTNQFGRTTAKVTVTVH